MMQQNFEFDVGKRFTKISPANVSEKNTHFCKKVIIAAYMRTGYSLIAGMFHRKNRDLLSFPVHSSTI